MLPSSHRNLSFVVRTIILREFKMHVCACYLDFKQSVPCIKDKKSMRLLKERTCRI